MQEARLRHCKPHAAGEKVSLGLLRVQHSSAKPSQTVVLAFFASFAVKSPYAPCSHLAA